MQLKDLLHELRYNILHDRSDSFGDSTSDYLWADQTLVRYIDQAQKRFARQSLILRDGSTPEVTQITIDTAVTTYELHKSVIAVLSARVEGERQDLARSGHSMLDQYTTPDPNFDVTRLQTLPPGRPLAFTTDEELRPTGNGSTQLVTLRLFPEPSAAYNGKKVLLRVARMPVHDLRIEQLEATPELPEDHHIEMLDWAAYLALRIVDTDAGSPARAQEFAASFASHVKTARDAAMRKLFAPQQWGFGRNGFSWEK